MKKDQTPHNRIFATGAKQGWSEGDSLPLV
jgi:hypothetical protein